MKRFWMVLSFLLISIIAAGVAWYFLYLKKPSDINQQELVPANINQGRTEAKKEKPVLFYRHPMNPERTSPVPMKDEMGMDFIPVYEDESMDKNIAGAITISPEKIQKIGVKIEEAKRRTLKRIIRTIGKVEYDESKVFIINAKVGGWVEKLYINRTDLMVHPNEKLLELYSPELVSTQEEYLLAIKAKAGVKASPSEDVRKGADFLVEAAKKRLRYWDISDEKIKKLEEDGTITRTIPILAPEHGSVTEKMVNEGQKVEAGEMLFKIIDHSHVSVYGEVYESEMPYVKLGQKAKIVPSYSQSEIYTAEISHIYAHLGTVKYETEGKKDESRTVKIRFELPNPEQKLKLGGYVNIELEINVTENALSIPDSAVIDTGTSQVVFVEKGEGRFEPRFVKVGLQADGYYQILSGLKDSERVVTSANFLIDSESNLKAALSGMISHQHDEKKQQK